MTIVHEALALIDAIQKELDKGVKHSDKNGNPLLTVKEVLTALNRDGGIHIETETPPIIEAEYDNALVEQFIQGAIKSGMKRTNCIQCGCLLLTRGNHNTCPPCEAKKVMS